MEGIWIDWHPVAVVAVMMALDMITGYSGAAKAKLLESGKMREGLWPKDAWLNAEVSGMGVTVPSIPAVGAVCTFVVATEAVSILENLCVLNPDIASLPIIKHLKPHSPEAPDAAVAEIDDVLKLGGTDD